jgi:hypothetical protein
MFVSFLSVRFDEEKRKKLRFIYVSLSQKTNEHFVVFFYVKKHRVKTKNEKGFNSNFNH